MSALAGKRVAAAVDEPSPGESWDLVARADERPELRRVCRVTAFDRATVTVYGDCEVTAYDESQVTVVGPDPAGGTLTPARPPDAPTWT